ncbi:YopX family protein [Streptococcus anginosus]|uniref:YopX family protein n=1 Tax=Streptococcus anginosus TaxID=1328 RepID=UPI0022E3D5C1|nr:YopX family protein [Streptococcus anginosus]
MELIPKFRAWLPTLKWMCEVTVIDYDLRSVDICRIEDVARHTEMRVDKDEVVLMQSTGLKDKNDVEIFEGDVVKQKMLIPTSGIEEITGVVKMLEGAWTIVNNKKEIACHLWREGAEMEVLGNIYENPFCGGKQ